MQQVMDDKCRMLKFSLNGSWVKVQMVHTDSEGMSAASVTLQLSTYDRPKGVQSQGTQINLYVETHDTEWAPRDKHMHDRYFYIIPTGAEIPETAFEYIDTCTDLNGFVWHIYEGTNV